MIINKITLSVDYNYGLKRLNTKLNESSNQNSLKSPKLFNKQIRKRYYKTLGTSVIKSPMSPSSLFIWDMFFSANIWWWVCVHLNLGNSDMHSINLIKQIFQIKIKDLRGYDHKKYKYIYVHPMRININIETNQDILKETRVSSQLMQTMFKKTLGTCIIYQKWRGQWAVYYSSPQSFLIRWPTNFGDFY